MKNVERIPGRPVMRMPMQGAPPLRGWALQYEFGIDDAAIKKGFWMSQWYVSADRTSATFNFDAELHMVFGSEAEATEISKALRANSEIETKVVPVGAPLK